MFYKKYIYIFLPAAFSIILSCSLFNITSIKANEYSFIQKGDEAGKVQYKIDEFGLDELTCYVHVFDDKICTVDNVNKRIQVMQPDGTVELIIGTIPADVPKKIRTSKFKFINIGALYMDDEGNLYVQNKLNVTSGGSRAEFSPSYILVFNSKGNLQYTLGQYGSPQQPFYEIETIDVDNSGRLIVITRTFDVWNVYSFTGKKPNYNINLGKLELREHEGEEEYTGKIENVKMYSSGDMLLISVAYYHGLRLKYRKVYNYSTQNNIIEQTVLTIPDPKNVLFNIVDDKLIYFWNIDDNIKFVIYNLEGKIISNIKLSMQNKNYFYTKMQGDRKGNLYSFHVKKDGIQVFEWE